jgi:hypothetical protein
MKTFIMMRFYDGGGLADYDFVTCEEEDLYDHLVKFEKDCVRNNLGTRIGVLETQELREIISYLEPILKEKI